MEPTATEQEYPGQRLGLPRSGRGSVAGWGRRIAALFVDWIASSLVAAAVFGPAVVTTVGRSPVEVSLVFLVEVTVFTALAGGSFGQLALRVAVTRLDGQRVSLLAAFARTVLILLVIPPVVYNRDNRGLHDLATGTATVLR